jgi:hypothetical protein
MAGNGANRLRFRSGANEHLIVAFPYSKAAGPRGHIAPMCQSLRSDLWHERIGRMATLGG